VEEEREYKRMELPGRFTAKVLYGWDDQKFEEEYLNKLEKNWKRWKRNRKIDESEYLKRIEDKKKRLESRTFLRRRNLKRGVMSRSLIVDFILFSLFIFVLLFISFSFSFFYF